VETLIVPGIILDGISDPELERDYVLRTEATYTMFWQDRRRSPYLFYLLTAGVEVVYFHLITLRHTPQSV
jgi:hypothetical protein